MNCVRCRKEIGQDTLCADCIHDVPRVAKLYSALVREEVIPHPWTEWQWSGALARETWKLAEKLDAAI